MSLTGHPTRPFGPPEALVPRLGAIGDVLTQRASQLGGALTVDALALLGERSAIAGLHRHGQVSCGGGTRLLPTADERWLAVSLARPEDMELVPAWLEIPNPNRTDASAVWTTVTKTLAGRTGKQASDRAILLGLPVGLVPPSSDERPGVTPGNLPLGASPVPGPAAEPCALADVRVVDMSSLWAGPLCGQLLAAAGASVIKVESTSRPDGARFGPPAFFDLLNCGKANVALDLRSSAGVAALRELLAGADVVIEAARPRALEHLGIDVRSALTRGRTRVWASITGHGRTPPGRDRVAFGDDAAAAGGLVSGPSTLPVFCADAIADPTSGVVAAAGVLDALATGGRWLIDVSMASVAEHLAGPTLPVPHHLTPAPPRARKAAGRAAALGADTAAVLAEVRR